MLVGIAAAALLLTGCGGNNEPAPTPVATIQPTAATPAGPVELQPVVWATAIEPGTGAPTEPVDRFTVDAETIYAVVPVRNLPAGSVLSATWTYNGVPVEPAGSSLTTPEPMADGYVAFHLSRGPETVWPDGTYGVAISLGGQVVQSAEVAVVER